MEGGMNTPQTREYPPGRWKKEKERHENTVHRGHERRVQVSVDSAFGYTMPFSVLSFIGQAK